MKLQSFILQSELYSGDKSKCCSSLMLLSTSNINSPHIIIISYVQIIFLFFTNVSNKIPSEEVDNLSSIV